MSIMLCTLCLNEMEHLPRLYEQHRNWPGLERWVFVEAADMVYAKTNPTLVSPAGLSVDGTSEFLCKLTRSDSRVVYIKHGICDHPDPSQGKVRARQRYMEVASTIQPKFIFVLDADEYYTLLDQGYVSGILRTAPTSYRAFRFKQRHVWRPASIRAEPLFKYEVKGGYWSIPHVRGWRWSYGLRYSTNHNTPEDVDGNSLVTSRSVLKHDQIVGSYPECVHLGFASDTTLRAAKHRYYVARGEGVADKRQWYVDCRAAFEDWTPGTALPHGASVVPYDGPIPEVFRK